MEEQRGGKEGQREGETQERGGERKENRYYSLREKRDGLWGEERERESVWKYSQHDS